MLKELEPAPDAREHARGLAGMAFSRSELLGVALIRLEVTRCLGRSAGKDRGDRWGLLEDLGYGLRLQRSGFGGRQSGGVFLASGPPLSISQWPNSTGPQDSPGKACLSIIPYSNFGGAAIRYGEVPGALGVLESPDNPMPIGIALRIEWAEPRAWRCSGSRSTRRISPGGGCAKTDGSCWSKGERGRGAGDALAKKGRARYCLTPMGACSPWGGQGSRGPVCWPQRIRDDPHPTGPRPRPSPRPGPPCRSASWPQKLHSTNTICPRVLAHQRRLAGPCREGNHG